MPFRLLIVCGSFHAAEAELSSYNRDHMAHKSCNIYDLALYRKKFADPNLDYYGRVL